MPLSWNEIKDRALRFSREWADEASEDAEAQTFLNGFFDVFGVSRRRVAHFERKVKKIDGRDGYIDLLWKGVLLVEQKSRGKDLDRAHKQARDYFHGLTDAELPCYLLVSDFARFRLHDLDDADAPPLEFALKDLHKHVRAFGFIAGYQARAFKDEDPVNIEAAAQGVLDARAQFPDATLADLYDPLTMPPALVKAHQALDRAVDAAYLAAEKAEGRKPPKLSSDAERVAFLFERYQALTSLLPAARTKKARKPRPA